MASVRRLVHGLEGAPGIGGPATTPPECGPGRENSDRAIEDGLGGIPDAGQDLDPGRRFAHRGLGGGGHRRRRLGLVPAAIWAIVRPVVTDVRYFSTGATWGSARSPRCLMRSHWFLRPLRRVRTSTHEPRSRL